MKGKYKNKRKKDMLIFLKTIGKGIKENIKESRNKLIVDSILKGKSLSEVGKSCGISRQRVSQIYHQQLPNEFSTLTCEKCGTVQVIGKLKFRVRKYCDECTKLNHKVYLGKQLRCNFCDTLFNPPRSNYLAWKRGRWGRDKKWFCCSTHSNNYFRGKIKT